LLQKWFAGTDHPSARDPYYLYSASNVGSILALLAYPLFVEPSWSLSVQSRTWTLGYGLFAVLTVTCAIVAVRRHAGTRPIADDAPSLELSHGADSSRVRWTQRAQWVALSFVPSSLLLGVTTYLSTDIAAVPLMWTVPLTLYLLSFVLAFAPTDMVSPRLVTRSVPLLVAVLVPSMASGLGAAFALFMIPLHLAVLFACALQLHTALARRRPDTRHLTAFYLWVACGGVLGGLFNTLLAPLVFTAVVEYPAALAAACLLRSLADGATDRRLTRADVVIPVAIGLVTIGLAYAWRTAHLQASVFLACLALLTIWSFSFSRRPFRFGLAVAMMLLVTQVNPLDTLHAERTFFGVLRVRAEASSGRHVLMHGSTVHGEQSLDPAQRQEPLTYYHRSGPMGQVIHALTDRPGTARVAVVGLGAGSLAAYATADQHWTFYEIDPAVVRIARDPRLFTYLSGCNACDVVLGDARLSLARAGETAYGLLVLDAFSSDGIPVHLLTREALELYLTKLEPRGVMAFHISNRHLHLRPVLAALAADRGLAARVQTDHPSDEAKAKGHYASEWFLMARAEEALGPLAADARWERPAVPAGTRVWTDDFSDIVAVLRTSWD
jgi:spermidine synthase